MEPLPLTLQDREGAPFTIRALTPADRPALAAMYAEFEPKRGAQGLPPEPPGIDRWLDRVLGTGEHLGVEMDGRLRGHLMLIPMDGNRFELANFLHQNIRNRGIGTMLNRVALDVARDRGVHRVWLCVEPSNRAAVRSYEKAGFRRTPGSSLWAPELEMEADLTASP